MTNNEDLINDPYVDTIRLVAGELLTLSYGVFCGHPDPELTNNIDTLFDHMNDDPTLACGAATLFLATIPGVCYDASEIISYDNPAALFDQAADAATNVGLLSADCIDTDEAATLADLVDRLAQMDETVWDDLFDLDGIDPVVALKWTLDVVIGVAAIAASATGDIATEVAVLAAFFDLAGLDLGDDVDVDEPGNGVPTAVALMRTLRPVDHDAWLTVIGELSVYELAEAVAALSAIIQIGAESNGHDPCRYVAATLASPVGTHPDWPPAAQLVRQQLTVTFADLDVFDALQGDGPPVGTLLATFVEAAWAAVDETAAARGVTADVYLQDVAARAAFCLAEGIDPFPID